MADLKFSEKIKRTLNTKYRQEQESKENAEKEAEIERIANEQRRHIALKQNELRQKLGEAYAVIPENMVGAWRKEIEQCAKDYEINGENSKSIKYTELLFDAICACRNDASLDEVCKIVNQMGRIEFGIEDTRYVGAVYDSCVVNAIQKLVPYTQGTESFEFLTGIVEHYDKMLVRMSLKEDKVVYPYEETKQEKSVDFLMDHAPFFGKTDFHKAALEAIPYIRVEMQQDFMDYVNSIHPHRCASEDYHYSREVLYLTAALKAQANGASEDEIIHLLNCANRCVNFKHSPNQRHWYLGTSFPKGGKLSSFDKFLKYSPDGAQIYKNAINHILEREINILEREKENIWNSAFPFSDNPYEKWSHIHSDLREINKKIEETNSMINERLNAIGEEKEDIKNTDTTSGKSRFDVEVEEVEVPETVESRFDLQDTEKMMKQNPEEPEYVEAEPVNKPVQQPTIEQYM